MLPSPLFLSAAGLTFAVACSPGVAAAQSYRPDAEGYPCAASKLAVVQDGPEFTIRAPQSVVELKAAEGAAKAVLAIGAALKVDRKILLPAGKGSREAANATRR